MATRLTPLGRPTVFDGPLRRSPSPPLLAAIVGVSASLAGLAIVAGVMFVRQADGTVYHDWSWIATALAWPLCALISASVLRYPVGGALAMAAAGAFVSFFFVWEFGQAAGIPLAAAGAVMLARRGWQAAATDPSTRP